jgi:hypothetical protein
MLRGDDWDQALPGYYPLFSLISDEDNWIEVGAVVDNDHKGAFRLTYQRAAEEPRLLDWPDHQLVVPPPVQPDRSIGWTRNSQFLLAMSYEDGVGLTVLASLGGEVTQMWNSDLPPVLRPLQVAVDFESAEFSTFQAGSHEGDVCGWAVFGGQWITGDTNDEGLRDHLQSLDFLGGA